VDERLLEHLGDVLWSSPELLVSLETFDRLDVSVGQLRERLQRLAQVGLVGHVQDQIFEINGEGERYLRGELDIESKLQRK